MKATDLPSVSITFDAADVTGRIKPSATIDSTLWTRIVHICRRNDPRCKILDDGISMQWTTAIPAIAEIASMRVDHGFALTADVAAEEKLRCAKADRQSVKDARSRRAPEFKIESIEAALAERGFDPKKRRLKPFQLRDLERLLSLRHGANFSVPGAGKTTVALALYLLAKQRGSHLLVICPKNALPAWTGIVDECMRPDSPDNNAEQITRVDGDDREVAATLNSGGTRFVITYDRLIRVPGVVRSYLSSNPVHVILDESHRIKSGDFSLRGRLLGEIAPLPIRRDILTGTPMPNSLEDIEAQIDFVWPGVGLGRRIVESGTPRTLLANLFVRTTKRELGLPPRRTRFEHVQMGPAQLGLYSILKSAVLRQLTRVRKSGIITMAVRRSVIRLLQASSNPVAAVVAETGLEGETVPALDRASALYNAVIEEGDSNKILRAAELSRVLASTDRKSVIWTIFTKNIVRLENLLSDIGVTTIYGAIDSGDRDDPETREGRINRFHDKNGPSVLVANPAACSEGINLHLASHDAIYLDRSYNAGHYLQSLDRIHRLGLPPDVETNVVILQSVAPQSVGSIDHSVARRLLTKLRAMDDVLNDVDIRQLALDEENAEPPIDRDMELEDLQDLLDQLTSGVIPADEELA